MSDDSVPVGSRWRFRRDVAKQHGLPYSGEIFVVERQMFSGLYRCRYDNPEAVAVMNGVPAGYSELYADQLLRNGERLVIIKGLSR